jgi:hypothetical protein
MSWPVRLFARVRPNPLVRYAPLVGSDELADGIRLAVGKKVDGMRRLASRGYSNSAHWVALLDDGRSVFVKRAADELTAGWLRSEHVVYQQLDRPWAPRLLGWYDDGERPILVLEDLSGCEYPPPWTERRVKEVLGVLDEVSSHRVPDGLRQAQESNYADGGWQEVARDPGPFLSLRLCSAAWLERALPVLLAVEVARHLAGSSLLHLDVRSDNLFFRDSTAVLVDWNLAAVGNPEFDVAFWLPSLRMEGGPEPESVSAVQPEIAALVAGFFASRAGLPVIPTAPKVRDVQLRQLEVALPWAARALDLPPVERPR